MCSSANARNKAGFTLVELVTVIALLAIVAVVVVPRFLTPSVFNELGVQDGLLAGIRSAQQAALGRNLVTFEIDQNADELVFTTLVAGMPAKTLEVPAQNIVLETGSVASGNTCAAGLDTPVANDFELSFGERGDLLQVVNNGVLALVDSSFNGVRICVNDKADFSVCVSPAGYAYAGDCDD